jgi:hemolysin III
LPSETQVAAYPSVLQSERYADGVVHIISLGGMTIACAILMVGASMQASTALIWACAVYCLGVMASFGASAGYHLLPWHNVRRTLRRLDHTAIYALIAGTFTPLLVHVGTGWSMFVLAAIWTLALPAMLYKLFGSTIEPKWSLASYLGLGWMGVLAVPDFGQYLPTSAIVEIFTGGIIYTAGTYFYARKTQVYRYAIWHSFVLVGTVFLFVAVWTTVFSGVPNA